MRGLEPKILVVAENNKVTSLWLSPEAELHLVSIKNRDLWPWPSPCQRKSAIHGLSVTLRMPRVKSIVAFAGYGAGAAGDENGSEKLMVKQRINSEV